MASAASVQAQVHRDFVLAKCDYFVDVQLWPSETQLRPRQWLTNFTPDEQKYAVQLLNSFLYFSRAVTDALLLGAVNDLARQVVTERRQYSAAQAQWGSFLGNVLCTYPTGETPNVTDSGLAFARKARQVLSLPQDRILSPLDTLEFVGTHGPREVLFLDDFLGTGNQFLSTWRRAYATTSGSVSFESAAANGGLTAHYVPLVATSLGSQRVAQDAADVRLNPAHALRPEYSALHPGSFLWPDHMRAEGQAWIADASRRGGIPDTNGAQPGDWRGFAKLGLALAFEHGVPDATLPLFYWDGPGWEPLMRRV